MARVLAVVARRTVNAFTTIFGIICLNYVLVRLMPGDPILSQCPHNPQFAASCQYDYTFFGLDLPPWQQFLIYLQKLFTLDWGVSYTTHRPVASVLIGALGWTLVLVGTSTIITILIGMAVGSYAALRRGKPFDFFSTGIGIFLYGMPIFWLGLVLQFSFIKNSGFTGWFSWWPVLPPHNYYEFNDPNLSIAWAWDWPHISSALAHLILPAATLSLGTLAGISLVMRSSLIDVMTEDFVLTARAKGLNERQVLRRHIFPSGLPPMVSLIALDLAFILGGAYQVEVVFDYYGIGWWTINAINTQDLPVLQFIIVIGGVAVVLANLISDFVLLWLDPRIKIT
ncbi:MAG TPA: ABC transporter permease [Thermoplasmata archaeon]|nr:ABC transporter permease [Thermoplasmata archaeon]